MGKKLTTLIPEGSWNCPSCAKTHKAPHWAHEGQVNLKKKPGEIGRVVFNRRCKDDKLDDSMPIRRQLEGEADSFDAEGYPKPLFCPHCGWLDSWIVITRKGPLRSLIDQFIDVINGNIDEMKGRDAVQQFMGFLKGRGIIS